MTTTVTEATTEATSITSNIDEALHSLAGIDLRTVKDKNVRSDIKTVREMLRTVRKNTTA